ncbi:MAG: hypothetical protein CL920_04210 [Deltaproteobacteria bacterium]|nr:hypothetical protein [Deltaproteobacteria bacterium]MBU47880.1 hypothetical protein [Deltaproteobacteria bacterium]
MQQKNLLTGLAFCALICFSTGLMHCSPPETGKEGTTTEQAKTEPTTEATSEPKGQDAGKEATPEKSPEPQTESQPEPQPEPTVEQTPEPTPTEQPVDEGRTKLKLPADPAAPKGYAGTCPTFKSGLNTIKSDGRDRTFILHLPPEPKGAPLLFVWHPLGGSAQQMNKAFDAANIAAFYKSVVVVPQSCCSQISEWTYVGNTKPDTSFFDDMLSCLDKQYDINNKRVYTTGFSAGSLWSSYLIVHRSEYLAAAAIFSGGVGLFPYMTPRYPTPLILAWGGASDQIASGFINFDTMAKDFEKALKQDNHYLISCNHGGGHTVPSGAASWGFPFMFDHTFGDGKSPYTDVSKRSKFPSYCTFPTP